MKVDNLRAIWWWAGWWWWWRQGWWWQCCCCWWWRGGTAGDDGDHGVSNAVDDCGHSDDNDSGDGDDKAGDDDQKSDSQVSSYHVVTVPFVPGQLLTRSLNFLCCYKKEIRWSMQKPLKKIKPIIALIIHLLNTYLALHCSKCLKQIFSHNNLVVRFHLSYLPAESFPASTIPIFLCPTPGQANKSPGTSSRLGNSNQTNSAHVWKLSPQPNPEPQ